MLLEVDIWFSHVWEKASFNFFLTIKANDVLEVILFLSLQ